jgi:hypothetical protein
MALHSTTVSWRRRGIILLAAASTTLGLAVVGGPAAEAAKPTEPKVVPDHLVITSALDEGVTNVPTTGPSVGDLGFAVVDKTFTVTVRSAATDGNFATVGRDVAVTLTASGPGELGGTVSGTILKGSSTLLLSGVTYNVAANIILSAAADPKAELTGDTLAVAVTYGAGFVPKANKNTRLSIAGCTTTPEVPTCVTLVLPNGAEGSALVSTANCSGITTACKTDGTTSVRVAQAYANLGDLYSPSNPATAIVDCDKSLCGNGGVNDFPLKVDIGNTNNFVDNIGACPAKGVIGADQIVLGPAPTFKVGHACIDYRQSTKDNAGDVHTYLLFDYDVKMIH